MTGATTYTANAVLNHITGGVQIFPLPSVYMGLFTVVGGDNGIGFTEPFGNGYARTQVSGSVLTNAPTNSGNATITVTSLPAWVTAGMLIYDTTTLGVIPANTKVLTVTGSSVTMSNAVTSGSVGAGDNIVLTAFGLASGTGSGGTGPSIISNMADIVFSSPTGSWSTVIAWGLFDQLNSGNLLEWDYLGAYDWLPVEISNGSPAVLTAKNHGYVLSDTFVYNLEYGGIPPLFSAGNLTGLLTVQAPITADTFTCKNGATVVNTSSTGSGMVRKIIAQSIVTGPGPTFVGGNPGGLQISFA